MRPGFDDEARRYIDDVRDLLDRLDPGLVASMADELWRAWQNNATVFVCGNGGSATTASHFALDLAKQTRLPGTRPLTSLALTDSAAALTAWANDAGYASVFAEQLAGLARDGDVLVCLSCSGVSPNITEAVGQARRSGMSVIGLGGRRGPLRDLSDVYVQVESEEYGMVESVHVSVGHAVSSLLRARAARRAAAQGDGPVVLIDRDGVINRNLDNGVMSWEAFEFLPGALEALALLKRRGMRVAVVTNQANVGRGRLTRAQLDEIHRRMAERVVDAGGLIEAIFVCEHTAEDGCPCRKPAPGLLLKAAEQLELSLPDTFVIGDHESDVAAARAAGARHVLVLSGRQPSQATNGDAKPEMVAADLMAAARMLTDGLLKTTPPLTAAG